MKDLIKFCIDNLTEYCPIALNCAFLSDFGDDGISPVCCDESILDSILSQIELEKEKIHILDFAGVDQISPREEHYDILTGENYILYVKKKFYNAIQEITSEKRKMCFFCPEESSGMEWAVIYFSREENVIRCVNNPRWDKSHLVECVHREVLLDFFMQEILVHHHRYDMGHLKYLESSNVFVNCYINVKSIFSHPDYLHMIIHDMAVMMKEQFHEIYNQRQICLLGVSNNGIILSKLVAYKLGLEAKSLNHLGPRYNIEKNENEKRLPDSFKDKKFILVSDVICMGGEYRIAKGIIEVIGAELLGAIGVVKIMDVYRNTQMEEPKGQDEKNKIYALVDNINTYEKQGNRFDYHIYTEGE